MESKKKRRCIVTEPRQTRRRNRIAINHRWSVDQPGHIDFHVAAEQVNRTPHRVPPLRVHIISLAFYVFQDDRQKQKTRRVGGRRIRVLAHCKSSRVFESTLLLYAQNAFGALSLPEVPIEVPTRRAREHEKRIRKI